MESRGSEAELERALRDERVEREAAQRRAAKLANKARLWEGRAAERAERIEKLVAERDQLRTVRGWLRARAGRALRPSTPPPIPGRSETEPAQDTSRQRPRRRAFPALQVGTLVRDPVLKVVLDEMDAVDLSEDPGALDRADLIVVEGAAFSESARSLREHLAAWSERPARQPLAFVGGEPIRELDGLCVGREWAPAATRTDWTMPTSFDATRWSPAAVVDLESLADADWLAGVRFVRRPFDTTLPSNIAAAAAALPIVEDPADLDADGLRRLGSLQRRTTHAERAPWHVAGALLDRMGIGHEPTSPTVAGILVSNRADRVASAIEQFANQRYPRRELVVGCHGIPASTVAATADRLSAHLPITVLEFDGSAPLGKCLNSAIASTSAAVIAKIDDDDHYGSGYLTDAVQAMGYADARLVGKGATFTYLEGRNATILRRPDISERFYDGSPTGASLVFERHLWEQIAFPHRTVGEDFAFVRGAALLGVRPYATSPWDFVYSRAVRGNTWDAIDAVFLEGSEPAWEGHFPERADLER